MNYGIKIVYKNPHHKLMRGIYKISIGDRFYIGQARILARRMYSHQMGINNCLRHFGMPKESHSHYINIARYLHEHPLISSLQVEVIQRCVSTWDLLYAEQGWLTELKTHSDCFNESFTVPRRYINESLWEAEVFDGWLIKYFDPSNPMARKYDMYTPLTSGGKIAKPKPPTLDCSEKPYIRPSDSENNDTA
jgi:hypothetical protein